MSSQISFSNLSQANQAYILKQNTNSKSTIPLKTKFQLVQDVFTPSKKGFKKRALIATAAIATGLIITAIKRPQEIKEVIEGLKELFVKKKNSISFNNEKLFDKPINLDECYDAMKKKLSNVKLDLAFDESKVTDDEIKNCLKKFDISMDYWLDRDVALIRKNPNKLHALNILSKFDNTDKISGFKMRMFIEDLYENCQND